VTFDPTQRAEIWLRSPKIWIKDIATPTFIIEGDGTPGNIDSLKGLETLNKNPQNHFAVIKGATHFSVLQPLTRYIASQMIADNASSPALQLTPDALDAAFRKAKRR